MAVTLRLATHRSPPSDGEYVTVVRWVTPRGKLNGKTKAVVVRG
jgi:hypothetical protein